MFKFYTAISVIAFSSCTARLNYLGSSFAPSKNVDVYVDASSIKKPYTIIGKGYMEYSLYTKARIDKMQTKAIKKAKEKGADAILFQDYFVTQEGTRFQSVTKTDSVGKGLVTVNAGSVGPILTSRTDILFLKYN